MIEQTQRQTGRTTWTLWNLLACDDGNAVFFVHCQAMVPIALSMACRLVVEMGIQCYQRSQNTIEVQGLSLSVYPIMQSRRLMGCPSTPFAVDHYAEERADHEDRDSIRWLTQTHERIT